MTYVTITGKLTDTSKIAELSSSKRKYQRLTITTIPQADALGRFNEAANIYHVFIYGEKEIAAAWSTYRDNWPPPGTVTVLAALKGRLKIDKAGNHYNNITLELKKITFNYE